MADPDSNLPIAVLVSGGLDSAVLLGVLARSRPAVFPLYVRCGLAWEIVEFNCLQRFVKAVASAALHPVVVLDLPMTDLYGQHWSTGRGKTPGSETADDAVYLPGRNVLLLAKALVWCHLNNVSTVALAVLEANPFPDATPTFFRDYASVVSQAVSGQITISTPFAGLTKAEVIHRSRDLPVQYTFSCLEPKGENHCGICNKCAERQRAFRAAGVPDPTQYYWPAKE